VAENPSARGANSQDSLRIVRKLLIHRRAKCIFPLPFSNTDGTPAGRELMANHRTVLVVEPEPALLDALGFALRRRGYHVLTATDGHRAAELLDRNLPDALVTDMFLPGQSGFQVARLAKERSGGTVPVVMLSRVASEAHRDYAIALGVDSFPAKLDPAEVVAAVETLCPLPTASRLSGSGSLPWPTATPG
jgi:CheY-like chemotaxis protein